MNSGIINEEIDDIINNMPLKSFEKNKKDIIKNMIIKFIQNGETKNQKTYLLNLVKNISWYSEIAIKEYIELILSEIFDSKTKVLNCKNVRYSSSSVNLITHLASSGIISDDDVIQLSDITDLDKNFNKIVVVDDFIGSGDTVFEALKFIEENQNDREIIIISYICHSIGEHKINNFVSKNNNKYKLVFKILEKSYLEKNLDEELIYYIIEICNKCKFSDIRFGWKNCGSMISINGVSPNNNISMLYGRHIDEWDALLDRNFNWLVLNERKNKVLLEYKDLITSYYRHEKINKYLTYNEFKMLILIYNCYGIDETILSNFQFCATIQETKKMIDSLINKQILSNDRGFLFIESRKILSLLRKFEKYISIKYQKVNNSKFY